MAKSSAVQKREVTTEGKAPTLPLWVQILVALVPVAALIWAVFKDTALPSDPKPAPPIATQPVPPVASGSVSATGTGSVAVGNMSGGTIASGGTPITPAPALSSKP